MIVVALLFAIALIASSFVLRQSATGDWVDAGVYLALGCWFAFEVAGRTALCGRVCRAWTFRAGSGS
jgi:hypothetical protein